MRKSDYAKLFTLRKDGVYQKYVNGRYLYSKDPEKLYEKVQAVLLGEPATVTMKMAAECWEKSCREQISERTWLNYKPHYENIIRTFGTSRIEEITSQDVLTYLTRAKMQGYSATVIKTKRTILNQIFNQAIVDGNLKFNPVTAVRTPRGTSSKRRAPTEQEMHAVFANIDQPFGFFPFFLLCTGMRKSEALALTKADVNLTAGQISVTKSLVYLDNCHPDVKSPKTEAGNRVVPIPEVLRQKLEERLNSLTGDLLFPGPKGGYMTEKAFEVAWRNYCCQTGLNITAHQLRHGSATVMFESGVDVYTAKSILGHANISTTMEIYTDLREAQRRKSIANLDNGLMKYMKGANINEDRTC